jgi:hypothetical protein
MTLKNKENESIIFWVDIDNKGKVTKIHNQKFVNREQPHNFFVDYSTFIQTYEGKPSDDTSNPIFNYISKNPQYEIIIALCTILLVGPSVSITIPKKYIIEQIEDIVIDKSILESITKVEELNPPVKKSRWSFFNKKGGKKSKKLKKKKARKSRKKI